MTGIFDTHSHYADSAFDEDREQVLAELPEKGVKLVMLAASGLHDSAENSLLSQKYGYIYAAAGVHPECVDETPADYLDRLREMISANSKIKAVVLRVNSGGGTATAGEEMAEYDSSRVHGAIVTCDDLDKLIEKTQDMPLEERQRIVGLEPKRAPVIVAGLVILRQLMDVAGLDELTVSEADILQGIVLDSARA